MTQPAALSIGLDTVRTAFVTQAHALLHTARGLDDLALLAPSRCHGWARLDVLVHVRAGVEEMLRAFTAPTDAPATVDAAGYWAAHAAAESPDSTVDGILWTRRTASAYRRPGLAVAHLADAVDAAVTAAGHASDRPVRFQGLVLDVGDFLATWAVELAVHHVDLRPTTPQPSQEALDLTVATIIALSPVQLPRDLDAMTVLLAGTGREPHPEVPAVLG